MDNKYFNEIFKRKSFHLFRGVGQDRIEQDELNDILEKLNSFEKLYPDIKIAFRIVKAKEVNFKRDAEYCILIYSEKCDNYLMNVGYIGEQLDLYLVSKNIGTLWFGIGKPDQKTYNCLDYVIMIAIHKINDISLFRKDMFKSKRKLLDEIWKGDSLGVGEIARFSPSACNTQPWYVINENNKLTLFRYKKPGKRGIMPAKLVSFYNRIDIGIFMCILEICLSEKKIVYDKELFVDDDTKDQEYSKVCEYFLK